MSSVINDRLGTAYLWVNDNVRAAEHFAIGAQLGFRHTPQSGYMVLLLRLERYNEFKAVMAAFHQGLPDSPDWLIENADTVFLPENRKQTIEMARRRSKKGNC